MAVKAVNDTVGPDGLVPTLLVFGAYPRVFMESPLSPAMVKRGEAIAKAMKALRKLVVERNVKIALGMRSILLVLDTITLLLRSDILVWREKKGWIGLFLVVDVIG